ncbi:MAG: hypothetical protein DMG65_17160 [Candidatus Angelobacter sp. Gp1-AA117]|nr:MAG: hypothetical protein DMG65_17160 [Candidatus Angelobacter sp. Gp1-AA117]
MGRRSPPTSKQRQTEYPASEAARLPRTCFFLSHSSDTDVRQSLTEYQDIALRTWIPEGAGNPDSPGLKAAHLLADLLNEHGDNWLNHFLKAIQPGDAAGIQALSTAITKNKRGLYNAGQIEAERAEKIFGSRNVPGALRARFEFVYASQRLLDQELCLKRAQGLERELRGTSYRWLQIQIALEEAVCLNFHEEFEAADQHVEAAREEAKRADYPLLKLRAISLGAGMKVPRDPDVSASWQEALEGLAQYWNGPSAPDRLYEFLTVMKRCLIKEDNPDAARAFEESMVMILEKTHVADENLVLKAIAHADMSEIYLKLNDPKSAEKEADIALGILQKIPPGEIAARKYEVPIEIEKAELQLERNDAKKAAEILDGAKELLDLIHDELIRLRFIRVQGDVWLRMGQLDDAERTYKTGLELAEQALANLHRREDRQKWADETGELYRGLVNVFMEQKKELQALQLWRWYQARTLAASGDVQTGGISWDEIQGQVSTVPLPAEESGVRIVYAAMKDNLYAWTIKGTEVKAFSVAKKQKTLKEMVTRYAEKCSTPGYSNPALFDDESKKLFAVLLQPFIAVLQQNNTVAVELDPAINGVFLETLKSPEGWYFGQKYPVIYSPGWVQESVLRPFGKADQGVFLNAQPRDIPEMQGLEKTVTGLYPAIESLDPSDLEAWHRRLATSQMLIFFGHGKAQGLIYAGNQVLRAQDFPPDSLAHLQIAALIACSTGSAGQGLIHTDDLVHAFLAGGTPNVVASNWDVDSRATGQLIAVFLHSLKAGKTPANAMYEARKSIFIAYAEPYYWAAFSVVGKAN